MTGEADPVNKTTPPASGKGILKKTNILFSGTLVISGTAVAVVCTTGMSTEIGKI